MTLSVIDTLDNGSKVKILKVLKEAKSLIEKSWTQGKFARDKDGNGVDEYSDKACSFCTLGAIKRVIYLSNMNFRVENHIWYLLGELIAPDVSEVCHPSQMETEYYESIWKWNDSEVEKKEEVIALFDRAIEKVNANTISD